MNRFLKVSVLTASLCWGVYCGEHIARATCLLQCDRVTIHSDRTSATDNQYFVWTITSHDQTCFRIYNTDTPLNPFAAGVQTTKKRRVCDSHECSWTCYYHVTTQRYSPVSCSQCSQAGEEEDISCWEYCTTFP